MSVLLGRHRHPRGRRGLRLHLLDDDLIVLERFHVERLGRRARGCRRRGAPEGDERLDAREEVVPGDRLVDVVLGAGPQLAMLLERLVARLARHDDERDVLERRILLQLVADAEAVHPRQLDREQDQIRTAGRRLLEARIAVIDDVDVATEFLELGSELACEGGVALEHEDFLGHWQTRIGSLEKWCQTTPLGLRCFFSS